jgi:hypothetical protein
MFSPIIIVSALSLLSCTHALALVNRQSDCSFVCPDADTDGNGLSTFTEVPNASLSCTYSGALETPCTYDSVSLHSRECSRFVDLALADLGCAYWR